MLTETLLAASDGGAVLETTEAQDSREYDILKRSKQISLGTMYGDESVWMVHGAMNEND